MWQKIFFNSQSIQAETDSAVLIKMPNKSEYQGYCFWHPKKLVREQGGKGYHYTFSFTEDFVFHLKKYGQGRHNRRDVIREVDLSVCQIKKEFGVVDENVNLFVEQETDRLYAETIEETTIEKHVPELVDKEVEPIPSLER
ncbi:hypothetical protein EZS27_003571 [termite gut metagenome]|uniref:Uncharacterized protein n=1 Tax=termite gut metagenome TaxID=433724 RepID=A0A5J4SU29_9ZZZZ